MDFAKYKDINDRRLNYREMEDASVVSSYRNTGCGDGYRIYLKIDEQDPEKRILDASYTTTGCGFGLTALAMATQWVAGKTLKEAGAITPDQIEEMFEFPERRKNYPESAAEAMQKAVADYLNGTGIRPEDRVTRSVALEKLKINGHLRGENLSQVVLEGEDLHGVDFTGANLQNAFLQNSNLEGAILEDARLRGAFLNSCNLKSANLKGADLRWAKLSGAIVDGADFSGAQYDIGTRLDQKQMHLFQVMVRSGRDIYTDKEGISASAE